ncbi:urea ABC transporter permease subunit UrtC [Herbaspirillum sp. WKF16]|uniref:urea ABC transporter permease subunit UrtC n=1 Tax=Herbaspirillum sp. WKF16 TaxID=3028312 RepID=UPI0023A92AE6|nr:urea ABC transporter permease subunit UrtC [Herbaspirillum sp. WKF16]WDZ94378.1 urea ABC transporter permease subunit UrtC [Herbaspirillum sp. WKF16]
MNAAYEKILGGRSGLTGLLVMAALLLVVFPLTMDMFRLNLVGKYLSYAFVAVGLVLCWGYGGILSLGQGVFFGLGGYCMAMFLKLEASDPISTKIQSTPGIPDFMDWNQITALPAMWQPFHSLGFTVLAVLAVPTLLAFLIGIAMFKRRVGDVYFSIVTQAIAAILAILIIGQQGLTGGVNGITDLKTMLGWDIRTDSAKLILYFVNAGLLFACILLGRYILSSKLGRLLVAMRDKEERVRFSGYDVASFKVFVFCAAAMFSAIGGAMFTLQVGFMSPSFVGIVPSIEMVIYAAVGGRMSLLGAVYGTLLVNFGKTYFSETFPELWLFLMGGLFIAVVMYFPNGLAGLYQSQGKRLLARLRRQPAGPDSTKPKAPAKAAPADTTRDGIEPGATLEASK